MSLENYHMIGFIIRVDGVRKEDHMNFFLGRRTNLTLQILNGQVN
jgi:hypothetical protein